MTRSGFVGAGLRRARLAKTGIAGAGLIGFGIARCGIASFGIAALIATTACWTTTRPTRPEVEAEPAVARVPPRPRPVPPATDPVTARHAVGTVHPADAIPEVLISEVEGIPVATMARYVDVSDRLERCAGPYGETIEIVMVAENGEVTTSLRDSSADDAVTSCVLNALAHDLDDILAPSGTPSDRPARVKSLLTIRFGN